MLFDIIGKVTQRMAIDQQFPGNDVHLKGGSLSRSAVSEICVKYVTVCTANSPSAESSLCGIGPDLLHEGIDGLTRTLSIFQQSDAVSDHSLSIEVIVCGFSD